MGGQANLPKGKQESGKEQTRTRLLRVHKARNTDIVRKHPAEKDKPERTKGERRSRTRVIRKWQNETKTISQKNRERPGGIDDLLLQASMTLSPRPIRASHIFYLPTNR